MSDGSASGAGGGAEGYAELMKFLGEDESELKKLLSEAKPYLGPAIQAAGVLQSAMQPSGGGGGGSVPTAQNAIQFPYRPAQTKPVQLGGGQADLIKLLMALQQRGN